MGKGKGNPEEWVAVVKPGRIMYEMIGVPEDVAARRLPDRGPEDRHHDEVRLAHEGAVVRPSASL